MLFKDVERFVSQEILDFSYDKERKEYGLSFQEMIHIQLVLELRAVQVELRELRQVLDNSKKDNVEE